MANILSPNLIGSSEVPSHEDSESGLNSKITFGTKESFGQITEELTDILQTSDRSETGNTVYD